MNAASLWVGSVGRSGVWAEPIEYRNDRTWTDEYGTTDGAGVWWDETGNWNVDGPGLHVGPYATHFAHPKRAKVETWLAGAQAFAAVLHRVTAPEQSDEVQP